MAEEWYLGTLPELAPRLAESRRVLSEAVESRRQLGEEAADKVREASRAI
jgi:hypothetical protein